MKHILKKSLAITIALSVVTLVGCKKDYLETSPSDAVTEQQIYSNTADIIPVLDGAYLTLFEFATNGTTGHDNYGQKAVDLANDLLGQDMVVHSQGYGWFNRDYQYTEWLLPTPANRRSDIVWYLYYNLIKTANAIIANVDGSNGDPVVKESLKGQAFGLRAYAYYYLINNYQQTYKGNETKPGVPIYTADATEGGPRGTVQETYDQIKADLDAAETLLTGKARTSKVNMDVQVIKGFKARVALLQEDWATAATNASQARAGYNFMSPTQYTSFTAFSTLSSPEVMWGSLIPNDQATIYASFMSHMDVRAQGYAALGGQKKITKTLYDQISGSDIRKAVFTAPGAGSGANVEYNQRKFQLPATGSWAADYIYMRSAEMYLIEAEALAKQGNDAGARTALETLVQARFPGYSAGSLSGTNLLNEIYLQRRIELWGEGFSLLDIKRLHTGLNRPTGTDNHGGLNSTGNPNLNPIVYTLPDADPTFLMRIPQRELDSNGNMTAADQNP
ncbi:MAG: RagB/SusD family nutrient uptake outer membrane protein [Chitinophagaceae bacterium]|nr:RagB/SusD family nutrient uptake outer membrane protein [Chitinophagaceae bacterium]MCW5904370.1 RagB/SusD family nutrient uptake outer membrane protein [Chitinophagaceae bacterium]